MTKNDLENKINITKIPKDVILICQKLSQNNFESYLVGGCVRDLIISREPNDWDIATNAKPEEIINIFGTEDTIYENKFGTVGIKIRSKIEKDNDFTESFEIIEVTTYRKESEYEDFRRPNKVDWGKTIQEDLERRDFTINAIAFDPIKDIFIDIYNGQDDISNKIIRSVGDSEERFNEDALRMLRAIRFSAQLGFTISHETFSGISKLADNIQKISKERIRDEFSKIIMTSEPMTAIAISQKLGLLKHIIPELENGIDVEQNSAHSFDVYEHNLRSLAHAANKNFPFHVRVAALLHDISKPETRRWSKEQNNWTFYGHDVVGERVARKILERLKFDKNLIQIVTKLVRWHMFFSDTEKITISAVRRLIVNIEKEYIWDLMDLRLCDRIGTGRPTEDPYRFRAFKVLVDEALRDPISLKTLKIDGIKIMEILNEKPSRKIGLILNALFEEVIDNSEKNTEEYLKERAIELNNIDIKELESLANAGKSKMESKNQEEIGEIKKKFRISK